MTSSVKTRDEQNNNYEILLAGISTRTLFFFNQYSSIHIENNILSGLNLSSVLDTIYYITHNIEQYDHVVIKTNSYGLNCSMFKSLNPSAGVFSVHGDAANRKPMEGISKTIHVF